MLASKPIRATADIESEEESGETVGRSQIDETEFRRRSLCMISCVFFLIFICYLAFKGLSDDSQTVIIIIKLCIKSSKRVCIELRTFQCVQLLYSI